MSVIREQNTCMIIFNDESWKEGISGVYSIINNDKPFYVDNTWTYNNYPTLRNAKIGNSEASEITFDLIFEMAGTIRFNYVLDTERACDLFIVYVDSKNVFQNSGLSSFSEKIINVESGRHRLTFRYQKDSSLSKGKDAVAIGFLELVGIQVPIKQKFLLVDFQKQVYSIQSDKLVLLSEVSEDQLNSSSIFNQYGFEHIPLNDLLLQLTKPKIYRWSESNLSPMHLSIQGRPKVQMIQATADLSHPTINGISSITSVYSGEVMVSYSYDGEVYTADISMEDFLSMDVEKFYQEAIEKKIYFNITLCSAESSLTNFIITYKEEE